MKTLKPLIAAFLFWLPMAAQTHRDSLKNNSYDRLILNMDATINSTYDSIQGSFISQNKISPQMKEYNNAICDELMKQVPVLESSIYSQFGSTDDTKNQAQPFITSLNKCIYALRQLTSLKEMISETAQNNYSNTYLFKELAKGNLFRYLNTVKITPTRFSVSLSMGIQSNPMNSTLQDSYANAGWKGATDNLPDLENKNFNKNLYASLQLNYLASDKVIAGIEYKTLPTSHVSGYSLPGLFNKTYVNVQGQTITINYQIKSSEASELIYGNAFAINADYIIKKNKPSGFGSLISLGGTLQLNLYTLERECRVSRFDSSSVLTYQTDTNGTLFNMNVVNSYSETSINTHRGYHLNSMAFGVHATLDYHLNKFASIKLTIGQFIDLGASVDELNLDNHQLPSYTLRFNSFSASAGMAIHF